MTRQWFGAALTVAALLLPAACARGPTEPDAVRQAPAAARWNTAPPEPAPTSGGYFGSGLRDEPPKDTTHTSG